MKAFLFASLVLLCLFSTSTSLTVEEVAEHMNGQNRTSNKFWIPDLFKVDKLKDFGPNFQCFVCTLIVGTMVDYADIHQMAIDDFIMKGFCKMFPIIVRPACQAVINKYGPDIIAALLNNSNPDGACRQAKVCSKPQCNLYKNKTKPVHASDDWIKYMKGLPVGGIAPMTWGSALKSLNLNLVSNHTPVLDVDKDMFSANQGDNRGFHWRGRDCRDVDKTIYPGRKTDPTIGAAKDFNCNGIHGKDPKTNKDYKEILCGNSSQLGVTVMGDSAGAHASIPVAWVNASQWTPLMFAEVPSIALDEVDFPQLSTYTGYLDWSAKGPSDSIYKKMYQRNKCNFRDYQNLAVNGAESFDTQENIKLLARNQKTDHPLLVFLELIGNDVCFHEPNFDVMTKPDQFKKNIIKILDYLDTRLPTGSHLVVLGLVNGSLLFEGVKNKKHPVGVTYSEFYDWTNCIEASFCWGWLNTDATVRAKTTQRAMELNQVYRDVLKTYKPKNYDFIYYDFPAQAIWDKWVKDGHDPFDLIEKVDGFHPNQEFGSLLADYLWKSLLTDKPEWLGPVNPNNALITEIFGDQGGY